jgi:hypothetical protein
MFISDPGSKDPGSQIRASKNLGIFNPKNCFTALGNTYDPHPDFFPSRIQGSKKHWISDPDPQQCLLWVKVMRVCDHWS